jgi:hypothetical protein
MERTNTETPKTTGDWLLYETSSTETLAQLRAWINDLAPHWRSNIGRQSWAFMPIFEHFLDLEHLRGYQARPTESVRR